jgi:hypothetical protein
MFEISLINAYLSWERKLEIDNEKRQTTRFDDVFTNISETQERKWEGVTMATNPADFIKAKLPACDPCPQESLSRSRAS